MNTWDYQVVRTYGGVVMMINGQETGKIVNNQPVGELLHEFLNKVGRLGWEVAGMAETRGGLELVLKRTRETEAAKT